MHCSHLTPSHPQCQCCIFEIITIMITHTVLMYYLVLMQKEAELLSNI